MLEKYGTNQKVIKLFINDLPIFKRNGYYLVTAVLQHPVNMLWLNGYSIIMRN